jgi:phenylpyruvate tautomerase PptA (4-oxalocrotonate tautomerase family)
MPTYTVYAAPNVFTDEQRGRLARSITEIHSGATGAPKSLVQTIFLDLQPGAHYIGGEKTDPRSVWVYGHIRSGRPTDVRTRIALDIRDSVESAGTPHEFVWVYLNEIPHTDMVEFGETLPPPGDEAAWIRAMPPAVRDRLLALG